jgi:hypothetical protein
MSAQSSPKPSPKILPNRRWRALALGLSTVLGLKRQGFFIPHRYADRLPGPGERPAYAAVRERLAAREGDFQSLLSRFGDYAAEFAAIGTEPPPAPRWDQTWFPRLDAAAAYTLVRERKPARIVEVGSGHSTRFVARAVADAGLSTKVTAIDPAPRAALSGLPIEWIRATLQQAGATPFESLDPGDMVIIDSSHILMPGSDVDSFFGHILPRLPAGILLHVHDIFLPDDYPVSWAWRGYNEQLLLLAYLHSAEWRPVWASHYVATRMAEAVEGSAAGALPLAEGAPESSLWLERSEAVT